MHDRHSPKLSDIAAAITLLTRLPLPHAPGPRASIAASAWAWPIAGALVGAIGGASALAAGWLGLPPAAAAGLALVAMTVTTGALHEDGLADCADGFWGGQDSARRLEIMTDSRLGSYGAMALILITGLRWAALAALIAAGTPFWPLVAAATLSRAPMLSLARRLPAARPGGLSAAVGPPGERAERTGWVIAILALVLLAGAGALGAFAAVAVLSLWLARQAVSRIGGQTGDVLGASQQLAEAAALLALAAAG